MSAEDSNAIRQVGAEDGWRSRAQQGLPERIEDPAAVAVLAAILRDEPAPSPSSESAMHETSSITASGGNDHTDRLRRRWCKGLLT